MPDAEQDRAQPAAQGGQPAQEQPQGPTLHVRDYDTKTSYANVCMLSSTSEEMILNFGISFPMPQTAEGRAAQMLVTNRIIMGLPAAKRLAIALSQTIRRYEDAFGVIELQRRRPAAQQPAAAPPADE